MIRIAAVFSLLIVTLVAGSWATPVEIERPQNPIDPSLEQEAGATRALTALSAKLGSPWRAQSLNGATGTIHLAYGSGSESGTAVLTSDDAVRLALDFIATHPDVFRVDRNNLVVGGVPWAPGKWAVNFRQVHEGLLVIGGRADVCMTDDGKIFVIGSDYYPDIDVSTSPTLSLAQARQIASTDLGVPTTDAPRHDAEMRVLPVHDGSDVTYHLVWEVAHNTTDPVGRWISFVDAHDATVRWRYNEVRNLDVAGEVSAIVEDPDYCADPVDYTLAHMRVYLEETGEADTTAADGSFNIPAGVDPVTLVGRFEGPFLNVNVDWQQGEDAQLELVVVPGTPVTAYWDSLSSRWDERDCFYHANLVHDFIVTLDPSFTIMNYSMPCSVGINQECNAYWDGYGINFFRAGDCANTGRISDVIYHEYGHGVTQYIYSEGGSYGPNSNIHEGNSDIISIMILNNSIIGNGFNWDCGVGIRNADNTLCWPEDMNASGHHNGQLISGFIWDSLQLLIGEIGETEALDVMRNNWHFGRKLGLPQRLEDQVFWTFVADDDNGNVGDGTPHWNALCTAADNHCFPCPFMGVVIEHEPAAAIMEADIPIPLTATIYSTLTDLDPDSLLARYSVNSGPFVDTPLTGSDVDSLYSGEMPAQTAGSVVQYFLVAEDILGNRATHPDSAPPNIHTVYVDPSFGDDFETDIGWTVGAPGDDATEGFWERVDPNGTWHGPDPVQPEDDHTAAPGVMCFITGQGPEGGTIFSDNVDGGTTTLLSPPFNLSGASYTFVNYYRWYTDDAVFGYEEEYWVVQVRNDGGPWIDLENTTESNTSWIPMTFDVRALFGEDIGVIEFAFRATDGPSFTNVVEAGVDDFIIASDLGGGIVEVEPVLGGLPIVTQLGPIAPNPLATATSIRYALSNDATVRLDVYDVSGRHVRGLVNTRQSAGRYALRWDGLSAGGAPVGAGVYFAKLTVGAHSFVEKLTVLR